MNEDGTLPRVWAVVLAGGTGTRLGGDQPKQLLQIAGRTMLERSVAAFDRCDLVDDIVVVMASGWEDVARGLVAAAGLSKVRRVIGGGASRSESTMLALQTLDDDESYVLIHDAARPLVEEQTIRAVVMALRAVNVVTAAIPSADTLLEVSDGLVVGFPPRERLRRVQTPQGFLLSTIRTAYERAAHRHDFTATDDCSVVRRYLPGEPIRVAPGSERNLKVTHPSDLALAEQLLRDGQDPRGLTPES